MESLSCALAVGFLNLQMENRVSPREGERLREARHRDNAVPEFGPDERLTANCARLQG